MLHIFTESKLYLEYLTGRKNVDCRGCLKDGMLYLGCGIIKDYPRGPRTRFMGEMSIRMSSNFHYATDTTGFNGIPDVQ